MSQLGKILLWVALVGALGAIGSGVALVLKFNDTKQLLHTTELAKERDDLTVRDDKNKYDALTAEKADVDGKLKDALASVDSMQAKLNDAIKQESDATTALTTANDTIKSDQDKLDSISKTLLGESPEDVMADKTKLTSDLQASQSEQKILEDQLQSSQALVVFLQDALKRSNVGKMPPGISGKITFVDHPWNFVILNVGYTVGVVPNGELIVYRNNTFLGKVKVTKVEANDAVAEILPDVKGDIQVGDKVLN
ncbi:MAG TPA: hypothetical protein VGZ93_13155 [Candidatus Methylacidiphilales bacterium]|jgi:hypothetical protein|nr:hypothetical protein [Candidatus Methylacidiphilales bacterium]